MTTNSNMKSQTLKRSFLFLAVFSVLAAALFFGSFPFLIRPAFLERLVREKIEAQTGYRLSFERFEFALFPLPVLHFHSFFLRAPDRPDSEFLLKADQLSVRPAVFALFFGRAELAAVSIKNASVRYPFKYGDGTLEKTVPLDGVFADIRNIRSNRPIRLQLRGKFLSAEENLNLRGRIQTDFTRFSPEEFMSEIQLSLTSLELPALIDWWGPVPFLAEQGTISFSGGLAKPRGSDELAINGKLRLNHLVYGLRRKSVQASPADYEGRFALTFNFENQALTLKEGTLTAPFGGPFQMNGKYDFASGTLEELYVKSDALRLEELPRYLLPLESVLPVNLGFSGQSGLDFFMKGRPELLTFNVRVDLAETNLTYSKYVSKSQGTPLLFRSDLQLLAGTILRGSFSVELEQAVLKGSIVDLNPVSNRGELTLLTNKFSLEGWERYFPPLRELKLTGSAKLLTSFKGNFNRIQETQMMSHLTLDNVGVKAPNGAELRSLNGSIDLSPLDSELKGLSFEIGDSYFTAEGKMFSRPEPRWLLRVRSPRLEPRDLVQTLKGFTDAVELEEVKINWNSVQQAVSFVQPDTVFETLEFEAAGGGGYFAIPNFRFNGYAGTVSGNAIFDFSKAVPSSLIQFQLDHLSLARMSDPAKPPILEGNLFAAAALSGEGPFDTTWVDRLKGRGSLAVTNGEFHTFDLLGGIGQIAELALLGRQKSGSTRFHDIRGTFEIAQKKVGTEDLFLVSDDFQIEAAGDTDFSGNLNYRLSIYLLPSLARRIASQMEDNERLGPIPLLLVGTITRPSIQKDPVLIQTFLDYFVRNQFSKIASRLMPKKNQPTESDFVSASAGQKPTDMKQALVESGFNLLEQLLSGQKTQQDSASS